MSDVPPRDESAPLARPFLKWAGGKRQLIDQIDARLPDKVRSGACRKYAEPFVGSGAVFFYLAQRYPLEQIFLADINPELILAYKTIQRDVEGVIAPLSDLRAAYLPLEHAARKAFYYEMRARFNAARVAVDFERYQPAWVERTAQLIFLNRTCYNGLFRVNAKGEFNVPFGRYKRPNICDASNLRATARLLQGAHIHYGPFTDCTEFVDAGTFVYFDPPYRPISATARFTAYSRHSFGDEEQLALAALYRCLDGRGACLMLSNSDPKNGDATDDFFEDAYAGFRIERVLADRRINSKVARRGPVSELLIMNY